MPLTISSQQRLRMGQALPHLDVSGILESLKIEVPLPFAPHAEHAQALSDLAVQVLIHYFFCHGEGIIHHRNKIYLHFHPEKPETIEPILSLLNQHGVINFDAQQNVSLNISPRTIEILRTPTPPQASETAPPTPSSSLSSHASINTAAIQTNLAEAKLASKRNASEKLSEEHSEEKDKKDQDNISKHCYKKLKKTNEKLKKELAEVKEQVSSLQKGFLGIFTIMTQSWSAPAVSNSSTGSSRPFTFNGDQLSDSTSNEPNYFQPF